MCGVDEWMLSCFSFYNMQCLNLVTSWFLTILFLIFLLKCNILEEDDDIFFFIIKLSSFSFVEM